MVQKNHNPLDDELLKELGLEPNEVVSKKVPPPKVVVKKPPAHVPAKPKPAEKNKNQSKESFKEDLQGLTSDMSIQIVAVLGKRSMTLKEVLALKKEEVVELKKFPHEGVDLVANGKLIARGELVLVEGQLGIQIKQLVGK